MTRSKALALHKHQYPNPKELGRTDMGSVVLCENKALIYEEAPTAYKDIEEVVRDLVEVPEGKGLVRMVASLKPLFTYKYKDPYKH